MVRACSLAILSLLVPSTLLAAAGTTTKITISGPELVSPIEITQDVASYQVWAGPGTSSNEAQSLIVDWAAGPVEPPKSQPLYQVSFETTRRNPSTYVVLYTFDPSTGKGFVYIPGAQHPSYKDNTWLILHGIEGKWFRAWSEWEAAAHPLIAKAPKVR